MSDRNNVIFIVTMVGLTLVFLCAVLTVEMASFKILGLV